MKKILPYLVAAALAFPVAGAAVSYANAQPSGPGGSCEHGGRHGGEHGGHHGGPGRGRHGDPAEHAEHRVRMLTAILDLDGRQAAEVRRILVAEATEMQAIHQQPRGEATHQAMEALHARTVQSIGAVLNATQRATMTRVEAARTAERAERRAAHDRHDAPPHGSAH